MPTTVPIREEDMRRLERLQARIALETEERPSLEEVLHRLLDVAEKHPAALGILDEPPQLTEEEKERFSSTSLPLGGIDHEKIDEILYGGPDGPV